MLAIIEIYQILALLLPPKQTNRYWDGVMPTPPINNIFKNLYLFSIRLLNPDKVSFQQSKVDIFDVLKYVTFISLTLHAQLVQLQCEIKNYRRLTCYNRSQEGIYGHKSLYERGYFFSWQIIALGNLMKTPLLIMWRIQ